MPGEMQRVWWDEKTLEVFELASLCERERFQTDECSILTHGMRCNVLVGDGQFQGVVLKR